MTQAEQDAEVEYRMTERLGLLVGGGKATIQQEIEALKQAEAEVEKIVKEAIDEHNKL